ncbi:Spy/CpxP family protein refolding chaperone [Thiobacillus sp.]
MKMTTPLLFAMLTALSLGAPPVHAQNAAPAESKPAAAEAEADRFYGAMQERYRLMQEQMHKIRQIKDPKERQKLWNEHWQTFHEGVGAMGGYGMGPGMMGGYGMGPGMMGGYGMGPGGGYGMGPGMMEGYGMGPGMMGGYGMGPQGLSDLSVEQRTKITKIQDETRKKHWELTGQIMEEQARLRDLYEAPKRDSAAVNNAHKKISELQRRMYETSADAHKRMEAVLTKEQKEKSWRFWRNW